MKRSASRSKPASSPKKKSRNSKSAADRLRTVLKKDFFSTSVYSAASQKAIDLRDQARLKHGELFVFSWGFTEGMKHARKLVKEAIQ